MILEGVLVNPDQWLRNYHKKVASVEGFYSLIDSDNKNGISVSEMKRLIN